MLALKNITLKRGLKTLLEEASVSIQPKQRVGIVGKNGSGKSSLFALFLKELDIDGGNIEIQPNITIAHLEQETPALKRSAIDLVLDGDQELRHIQNQLDIAELKNDGEAIAKWHQELLTIDGYSATSRAAKLLHGLGFQSVEHQKHVAEFSGGWRMRLNLAKALMCRSDLLLLDEPTNHLDMDALVWFEAWLKKYSGTVLIISHDKEFLDNISTHIMHIEHQNISYYTGNYSNFERQRAEKLILQKALFEKQQRQRVHMQKFVDRFRAKASKAKQAQSRIKMLEKMESIAPAYADSQFDFSFEKPEKCPNPLLNLQNICLAYDKEHIILRDVNLSILPSARMGILGANGAGKSTLINCLAGNLKPNSGEYLPNKGLEVGYFAQHQVDYLAGDLNVLQTLKKANPHLTEQQCRNFLGRFAFSGDTIFTEVRHLSGGEKARLALSLIVIKKPNLLLLDEPTNHFDMEMRHALSLALQEFEGAIIFVSHDRNLLRLITDELFVVHSTRLEKFSGDLEDYQKWLKQVHNQAVDVDKTPKTSKEQRKQGANIREQQKPLRDKAKTLESSMQKIQQQLAEINVKLNDKTIYDEANQEKLVDILKQQAHLNKELIHIEEEWFAIQQQLEL